MSIYVNNPTFRDVSEIYINLNVHIDTFPLWQDINNVKVELSRDGVIELIDANWSVPHETVGELEVYNFVYTYIFSGDESTNCHLIYTPLFPNDSDPPVNGDTFEIIYTCGEFKQVKEVYIYEGNNWNLCYEV